MGVFEDDRRGGRALDAQLLLFLAAGGHPWEGALHDERRELAAVDLGE
jgi:hypothetical protein